MDTLTNTAEWTSAHFVTAQRRGACGPPGASLWCGYQSTSALIGYHTLSIASSQIITQSRITWILVRPGSTQLNSSAHRLTGLRSKRRVRSIEAPLGFPFHSVRGWSFFFSYFFSYSCILLECGIVLYIIHTPWLVNPSLRAFPHGVALLQVQRARCWQILLYTH